MQHIPNFITILNLLTGVAAIWFVFESNPFTGALLVFLAAVFDFLDGLTARLLKAGSAIGKSLDSLADMVSFGVLPGVMVFKLLSISMGTGADFQWGYNFSTAEKIMLLTPLLVPALSALRLAKFDNDTRQTTEFRGLPTPANTIFIASWLASYPALHLTIPWVYNPVLISSVSVLMSLLLVSDIPMFSLKFRDFGFSGNFLRYFFLGISLVLLIILKIPGIMAVIVLYVVISFARNLLKRNENLSPY